MRHTQETRYMDNAHSLLVSAHNSLAMNQLKACAEQCYHSALLSLQAIASKRELPVRNTNNLVVLEQEIGGVEGLDQGLFEHIQSVYDKCEHLSDSDINCKSLASSLYQKALNIYKHCIDIVWNT